MQYDLLLKKARVVDPTHHRDGTMDLAIQAGKIVEVAEELDNFVAREVIDLDGLMAIPGVIDGHVHVSSWIGGVAGYRMMVKAGTVTAIDFAGPFEEILSEAPQSGYGMNIGGLESIRPEQNISSVDPSSSEIRDFVHQALEKGAIGIKILGGHFPMTPEATARAIQVANEENAYVAIHVGTTTLPRSDINSLKQALELADGCRIHVCHVCTCCLGLVLGDPMLELIEMMSLFSKHRNARSESHMSVPAYSFSIFQNGVPISHSTRMFLEIAGYDLSEEGLKQAMIDQYASAVVEQDHENIFLTGHPGFIRWKTEGTKALGFKANLPLSLITSAIHKREDGTFSIDALASDGGGIPRNNLIISSVALVKLGAFSYSDMVQKLCIAPAKMFGLVNKGHLGEGADADVTVIDSMTGEAVYTIGAGRVLLRNKEVVGKGVNIISTEAAQLDIKCKIKVNQFFRK